MRAYRLIIALSACALLGGASGAGRIARGQALSPATDQYLETVWDTEDGLPQNSVTAILQTRDGYLWLGTFGGLARFDGIKFTVFNTGNTPGLKANRILSLYEGRDSTLWMGTDTGEVMSFKDGAGKTYTTADGLPGSWVLSLGEDREGALWVGTSTHLARLHLHRRHAAQEAERKRIAAELHDSLGQNLLIIKNRAALGALASKDLEAAQKQLEEIGVSATQAIEEVRQIAYNLRPYHLDRLGLTNSLEAMLEQVAASSEIEFFWNIKTVDGALPKEAEINLYRVVQECLNNIVKHSGATQARVVIASQSQGLQVTIQDNGKGMIARPTASEGKKQGLGLTGIAERVRMLGGTHTIHSIPGQGTTVNVKIPLTNGRKTESP